MSEAKQKRFRDAAKIRVNRALRAIHSLQALAKPGVYEYSDDEIGTFKGSIEAELDATCARLADAKRAAPEFDW
jgi:hypothetical protein